MAINTTGQDFAVMSAAMYDVERGMRGPSGPLKILSGSQHETVEATYTTGWKFPRKEYDDLSEGRKIRKLYVADVDGTRKAKLKAMTALQVDSVIYKSPSKDPQLLHAGGVPVYEFKVSPTGERV